MKAMIFAAGLGTRLKPYTDNAPKALAIVAGRTLLEHSIRYLQQFGINQVVVNVHHFAPMIVQVLQENNGFGSQFEISDETAEVLETGGGLKKAISLFQDQPDFVALNVDVITTLNLTDLIAIHNASNALSTLAVMQRESTRHLLFNNDLVLCGWSNDLTGATRISKNDTPLIPYSFSGIQVVRTNVFDQSKLSGKFSLIDLYLELAKNDIIKGFDHSGDTFIDVGKPDSLAAAAKLLEWNQNN